VASSQRAASSHSPHRAPPRSCFFGVILISLFGLPLTLYHNSTLATGGALGLWLASTVVTFVGSIYYWIVRAQSRAAAY